MDKEKMKKLNLDKVLFFNKYVVLTEDCDGYKLGWSKEIFVDPPQIGAYYDLNFGSNGKTFVLVEKSEETFIPTLEELHIIKKIDNKYIYLIKNGDKKLIKFNKPQEEFSPLDLVYINGDKLIKDNVFTKYFKDFLARFDNKVKFDNNHFKIHRYLVEDIYKYGVSMCELDDIHKLTFICDYELNGNLTTGDIYLKFELGPSYAYIFDDDLKELKVTYNQVLMKTSNVKGCKTLQEYYDKYTKKINALKNKRKIFEKISKKAEEYYAKHPLPFSEKDIIGKFEVVELETDNVYRLVDYDDDTKCIYVEIKDLPNYVREKDIVILVKDKNTKQEKYYFTRTDYDNSFNYYLNYLEKKLDAVKERMANS